MAHLVFEVARHAVERRLLATQINLSETGVDILAPPLPIRRSLPTSLGTVRVQLIVRAVQLKAAVGSPRCELALTFDESSVEALSLGEAVGMLGGLISVSFALAFRAAAGNGPGSQIAQLGADLSNSTVDFNLDANSFARLAAEVGNNAASMLVNGIESELQRQFRTLGFLLTGLNFGLTPGVPSEVLRVVEALPYAVWVNAETLALSLRYAPQPIPEPFQPVPFLPSGNASAIGMWLSNDGFQRTVRNPAVRKLARDMLWERHRDRYIAEAHAKRAVPGPITQQDRDEGRRLFNEYLLTPQGMKELADETPSPTAQGKLRKRVTKVPDPFSDFDIEIPELDLWLGNDRIEGRTFARGEVNGFGFSATIRFRARPVLVQQPTVAIEMHDVQIDEPDLTINLPTWLEALAGILVGLIAGPVMGVIVGFLLSAIISSLVEAFIPSNLGARGPMEKRDLPDLPEGVVLTDLTTVPDHLAINGRWTIPFDDPRAFLPAVRLVHDLVRHRVGEPRRGEAWFTCLGALGIAADSVPGRGSKFEYTSRSWVTSVTLEIQSDAVPLPFTRFPWTIAIGHRSTRMYHFPVLPATRHTLVPGPLTVTADVWDPEPPRKGVVETRQFTIEVQQDDVDRFTIQVPPVAGCVLIGVWTKVVDASGYTWDLHTIVDVPNETVTLSREFTEEFIPRCERQRRDWQLIEEPSRLDKVWNPFDVYSRAVQEAIRTEQPGVTREIAGVLEEHGDEAFNVLLAPSLFRRNQ